MLFYNLLHFPHWISFTAGVTFHFFSLHPTANSLFNRGCCLKSITAMLLVATHHHPPLVWVFSDSFFTQPFLSVARDQLSRKTFLLVAWQLCGASQNVIVVTTYWIFANPISFVSPARQLPCWKSAAANCVLAHWGVLGFAVRHSDSVYRHQFRRDLSWQRARFQCGWLVESWLLLYLRRKY